MAETVSPRGPFSLRRGAILYERELKNFRDAYQDDPQKAFDAYGLTLMQSLTGEEALELSGRLGFEPRDAADLYNRGVLSAKTEDYTKAIEHFRHALEQDSTLLDAVYNLAICYERTKQFPQALSTWQTLLDSLREQRNAEEAKMIKDRIAAIKALQKQ
jgi:tetratricopeptide (TPR) repeat protein